MIKETVALAQKKKKVGALDGIAINNATECTVSMCVSGGWWRKSSLPVLGTGISAAVSTLYDVMSLRLHFWQSYVL